MSIGSIIKSQVTRFTAEAGVIVGFLAICIDVISHFTKVFDSGKFLIVFLTGLYIIILRVCWKIKHPDRDAYGKARYSYSDKTKKLASQMVILSSVIMPTGIAILTYLNIPKTVPVIYSNNMAIIITKFTRDTDPFSIDLSESLEGHKKEPLFDSIDVKTSDEFIRKYTKDCDTTIEHIFELNKYKKGLLVLGSKSSDGAKERHQDVFFNCYIFINKLSNLHIDTRKIRTELSNDKVLYLKKEPYISFDHSIQADTLSKFILGLLYFNADKLDESDKIFTEIKNWGMLAGQEELVANCDHWLGKGKIKKGRINDAIELFKDGIARDTTNPYLYNALASLCYYKKDTVEAYNYFSKAYLLDKSFDIPISKPSPQLKQDKVGVQKTQTPGAPQKKKEQSVSANTNSTTSNTSSVASAEVKPNTATSTPSTNASTPENTAAKKKVPRIFSLNNVQLEYQLIIKNRDDIYLYITSDSMLVQLVSNTKCAHIGFVKRTGYASYVIYNLEGYATYGISNYKDITYGYQKVGELREVK